MNIAFTIATKAYLAQAKTTADSFMLHHPTSTFFICLIGDKKDIPAEFSASNHYKIIDTASGGISGYGQMRERYSNFELSCALKPYFCELLLNAYSPEIIFYFDSDILIFNRLTVAQEELTHYSILLTPHVTLYGRRHDEDEMDLQFLRYGLYNGGFFAIRNTEVAINFLTWWKQKLFTECISDIATGRYVDQIWLNLVPIYFSEVTILQDAGYNMAVWNMSERKVVCRDNLFWVNQERPLVFFHFSSYNFRVPEVLSHNHPYFTFTDRPDVLPLFNLYNTRLLENRITDFQVSLNPTKEKEGIVKKVKGLVRRFLLAIIPEER